MGGGADATMGGGIGFGSPGQHAPPPRSPSKAKPRLGVEPTVEQAQALASFFAAEATMTLRRAKSPAEARVAAINDILTKYPGMKDSILGDDTLVTMEGWSDTEAKLGHFMTKMIEHTTVEQAIDIMKSICLSTTRQEVRLARLNGVLAAQQNLADIPEIAALLDPERLPASRILLITAKPNAIARALHRIS